MGAGAGIHAYTATAIQQHKQHHGGWM
jgi:hypothetical protein